MNEMTPEVLGKLAKIVRDWRLVRIHRATLDDHAKWLDAAADAWKTDKIRIQDLEKACQVARFGLGILMGDTDLYEYDSLEMRGMAAVLDPALASQGPNPRERAANGETSNG